MVSRVHQPVARHLQRPGPERPQAQTVELPVEPDLKAEQPAAVMRRRQPVERRRQRRRRAPIGGTHVGPRVRAVLQQYLARGMPRALSHQDSEALGKLLGCDAGTLRHAELPHPKPWKRKRQTPPASGPALATVSEMEVEVSAGAGAFNEGFVFEKARWRLPEVMVRHEGDADPGALRILKVRGNSMEPEMRDGDRLVVDTARRTPATGELFVLWDGTGLVVKRVEPVREPGAPRLRLLSTNPDYPAYTSLAEEVHIVGKVLWKVTKA